MAARNGNRVAKKKRSRAPRGNLLYSSTDQSADALYFGGVSVPDAFIAFSKGRKRVAVVNRLEFNRVRTQSRFDEVLPWEAWSKRAGETLKKEGVRKPTEAALVAAMLEALAKEYGVGGFRVPFAFPAGLALALGARGVDIEPVDGMLFAQREFKTDEEAAAVRTANEASEAGFRVVAKTLRAAEVRKGKLYHGKRPLTSERMRELIGVACLEHGADPGMVIVAGGDQACDPHHRGTGPLRAGELIIVDIFPRSQATGYHGDMTRTFLKGRASEAQRALVATVLEAQQNALAKHRAGADGKKLHAEVLKFFEARGYATGTRDGVAEGFFHGLGHGLGLEVHEPPRVSPKGGRLRAGQVITVEPGLYYPGLGGCRVEDVVRVTGGDPDLLSHYNYRWEIR